MTKKKKEDAIFINPIDPDKVTDSPHNLPYPHTAGSALVRPEDQGKLKGRSLNAMEHQTDLQLQQIYEQMNLLATQAKKLQDRKLISEKIYGAEMRFEPLINHIYHLYERENGNYLLSLIAPHQWNLVAKGLDFVATVRLLADHTWEIIEKSKDID